MKSPIVSGKVIVPTKTITIVQRFRTKKHDENIISHNGSMGIFVCKKWPIYIWLIFVVNSRQNLGKPYAKGLTFSELH